MPWGSLLLNCLREQVNMSFDTLYTLAKKMEAHQPSRSHKSRPGPSDAYRDKYRRYPMPAGWVATLEDEELFLLDPEAQSAPVLVFLDFDKPFLLETDASKEGLGAVLSQKQDDGLYHPIAFGSCSLTPSEKNYHSSKLEFLALKWSVTEHFKEYHAYALFVVRTNNNPLTYVLTTPNLNATEHRWVGVLASFKFTLEYQKGADNGVADALSQVPIHQDCETVQSLLEGAIMGATDREEAEVSEELLCEHVHLENEAHVQAAK